jgi:hypothetical protein
LHALRGREKFENAIYHTKGVSEESYYLSMSKVGILKGMKNETGKL